MQATPWYLNHTIIAQIVAALFGLLGVFKIQLPIEMQGQITDALIAVGLAASAVFGIYAHIKSSPQSTVITATAKAADAINDQQSATPNNGAKS